MSSFDDNDDAMRGLLQLVELLTRMASKKMRSEFVDLSSFLLLFGVLCQRGRKLEWSMTFSTPWRVCYSRSFYLCTLYVYGYGHVLLLCCSL